MSEENGSSYAKVMEYLYIGDKKIAKDKDLLQELGITYIVNATAEIRNYFDFAPFHYLKCPCVDTDVATISQYFEPAIKFIDEGRSTGHAVLVHCQQGVSRSASLVIAYLMKRNNMKLTSAYSHLRIKRPIVKPKPNFLKQLHDFENSIFGNPLSSASSASVTTSVTTSVTASASSSPSTSASTASSAVSPDHSTGNCNGTTTSSTRESPSCEEAPRASSTSTTTTTTTTTPTTPTTETRQEEKKLQTDGDVSSSPQSSPTEEKKQGRKRKMVGPVFPSPSSSSTSSPSSPLPTKPKPTNHDRRDYWGNNNHDRRDYWGNNKNQNEDDDGVFILKRPKPSSFASPSSSPSPSTKSCSASSKEKKRVIGCHFPLPAKQST